MIDTGGVGLGWKSSGLEGVGSGLGWEEGRG